MAQGIASSMRCVLMKSKHSPKKGNNLSDVMLLLTAGIWGFAFVAQRMGMEHVGPFTFNGIRFALGAAVLLPFLLLSPRKKRSARQILPPDRRSFARNKIGVIMGSILLGLVLFMGASLQQMGIVHTTAGNAGFITGLYVVIVPIMGIALGRKTSIGTFIGAILAALGLYLLSVTEGFNIAWGDLLVLLGAVFWAAHVLIISHLSPRINAIKLAITQFAICALLSTLVALATETILISSIAKAAVPILYGGAISVGIAYTLQVFAQKKAHPAHAAIILSLEAVFAAIGGWLILGEVLSPRGMTGAGLMLAGMLISQLLGKAANNDKHRKKI